MYIVSNFYFYLLVNESSEIRNPYDALHAGLQKFGKKYIILEDSLTYKHKNEARKSPILDFIVSYVLSQ